MEGNGFQELPANAPKPVIFNSCRRDKFSYHVHFPSYFFANRNLHAYFANKVWEVLKRTGAKLYPDPAIYGKGQRQFRVAYCFKIGKSESAKVPIVEKPSFDELTLNAFKRLLVSYHYPNVTMVTDLPGYSPNNKYGQPTGKRKTKSTTRARDTRKEASLLPVRPGEEKDLLRYLRDFFNGHEHLIWNESKVQSVNMEAENTASLRIAPGGDEVMCCAGKTYKSNCIL